MDTKMEKIILMKMNWLQNKLDKKAVDIRSY